jgi:hypothetical protein
MTIQRTLTAAALALLLSVVAFVPATGQGIIRDLQRVSQIFVGDGSAVAPSIAFGSSPTFPGFFKYDASGIGVVSASGVNSMYLGNGMRLTSGGDITWTTSATNPNTTASTVLTTPAAGKLLLAGTTPMLQLGGTSASFPALKQNGTKVSFRLADDSAFATVTVGNIESGPSGNLLFGAAAPSLGTCAGFGTSPTMGTTNGSASFLVNVGSAPPAGGTCTFNLSTAATGWNCSGEFRTSTATMKETSTTTTTAVMTVTGTPTAAEVAQMRCSGY